MRSSFERGKQEEESPIASLSLRSRYSAERTRQLPILADSERLVRNSSGFTSRDSLTWRSRDHPLDAPPTQGMLELFISRGAKTMQLSVRGLTAKELGTLVGKLGLKEMIE